MMKRLLILFIPVLLSAQTYELSDEYPVQPDTNKVYLIPLSKILKWVDGQWVSWLTSESNGNLASPKQALLEPDWYYIQRSSDTTRGSGGNVAWTDLGGLQFTMKPASTYEIDIYLRWTTSVAATGITVALNCSDVSNVGLYAQGINSATAGTDMWSQDLLISGLDSLVCAGGVANQASFIRMQGVVRNNATPTTFKLRWHPEATNANLTIGKESYIRGRRLY